MGEYWCFNIKTADDGHYEFGDEWTGSVWSVCQPVGMPFRLVTENAHCHMEVAGTAVCFSYEPSGMQVAFAEPCFLTEEQALEIVIAIGKGLAGRTGQGAYIPEYGLIAAAAEPPPADAGTFNTSFATNPLLRKAL